MTEGKKSFLGDYKNRESGVYLKQKARSRRRIPILAEDVERELIRRWHDHQDISARDKLIQAHLRLVPRLARKAADKFGYRAPKDSPRLAWDGYENVCRELELAGNEGLLIASYRFDPYREARFATCAVWWIAKMCAEEAKRLRSVVTFPRRLAALWDTSLDEDEFCEDAAVDIEGVRPDLAEEASPLTSDLAEEEQAFFSGLATILDAKGASHLSRSLSHREPNEVAGPGQRARHQYGTRPPTRETGAQKVAGVEGSPAEQRHRTAWQILRGTLARENVCEALR